MSTIQDIFSAAAELPPDQRAALLDGAGLSAHERAEVEELLESLDDAGSFLEQPMAAPRSGLRPLGLEVGQMIGPYRLVRPLGGGGMGSVYLAVRDDDEYRREVAVKLIRQPSAEFHARFLHERQVLAGLDHPNIGRLYEGGTTDDGRPYLVMEHVEGLRIDEYCSRRDLSVKARLGLFRAVCAAVGHAHRNLVVHRDLKPSNILVTAEGVAKLIDFGIAKNIGQGSGVTGTGKQGPMTLRFAAPEQVEGAAITTSTDVYALGVLLFRILTGDVLPYSADADNPVKLAVAICDHEPARLSSAVSGALRRELRGDLDSIVRKALEKRPADRYRSVDAFSADIGRHLQGLPVQARGMGAGYIFGRALWRFRLPAAAAGVALVVGLVFVVLLVESNRRAVRERDRAEQALSVLGEAFKASDPERSQGRTVSARQLFESSAAVVRETVSDSWIRVSLLSTLGEVYVSLGLFDEAESLHVEVVELTRVAASSGELQVVDLVDALYRLAELEYFRRAYSTAEGLYRDALGRLPPGRSLRRSRIVRGLGLSLVWLGESDEGEALLGEALGGLRRELPFSDPENLRVLDGLARVAVDRGDFTRAETIYREVVEARRPGGPGPALGRSLAELGRVRFRRGDLAEARALLEDALPILQSTVADTSYVAEVQGKLVTVLWRLGDLAGAETLIGEVLATLPLGHPGRGTTLHNLSAILTDRGELAKAERVALEALTLQREAFGADHENVGLVLCALANIDFEGGDFDGARRRFEECAAVYPPEHMWLPVAWFGIGRSLQNLEGCGAAVPWFRRAHEGALKGYQTAMGAGHLGACLGELGEDSEAEALLLESLAGFESLGFGRDDRRVAVAVERLRVFYLKRGMEDKLALILRP